MFLGRPAQDLVCAIHVLDGVDGVIEDGHDPAGVLLHGLADPQLVHWHAPQLSEQSL